MDLVGAFDGDGFDVAVVEADFRDPVLGVGVGGGNGRPGLVTSVFGAGGTSRRWNICPMPQPATPNPTDTSNAIDAGLQITRSYKSAFV